MGGVGAVLHWNGVAWTTSVSGTRFDLFGIWGHGSKTWAVGAYGTFLEHDQDRPGASVAGGARR